MTFWNRLGLWPRMALVLTVGFLLLLGAFTALGEWALHGSEGQTRHEFLVIARLAASQEDAQLAEAVAFMETANHRFEELFAGLPIACFTYDQEGRIHEWNRASEALYGVETEDAFLKAISDGKIKRRVVSGDDPSFNLGDAELRVLHPARTFCSREKRAYAAENDRSLVVRIAFHNHVLLFTGDIGTGAEKELLKRGQDLKCDLLKVPHHGSTSSSSEAFVSAVRPSAVVVTAGRGNPYHHPSAKVIERYERSGAKIYRTDRDGSVILSADGGPLSAVIWNELALSRIRLVGRVSLWEQERENLKRMYLRKWEL